MIAQNEVAATRDTMFGMRFSPLSFDQMVERMAMAPEPGQGAVALFTANLDHIVQLRRTAALREAYRFARFRSVDGAPLMVYARLRKVAIPGRVTGADLMPALLERMTPGTHRMFFLCSSEENAERLRVWAMGKGFAEDAVHTVVPPFGFERDQAYSDELAAAIRKAGATHLFFGVGCPKSEIWLHRHADQLGDLYAFAVGAALAFFTGLESRAPIWMRKTGLEWTWRVAQEPRRLAKRYFVDSWSFLAAIYDDLSGRTPALDDPATPRLS